MPRRDGDNIALGDPLKAAVDQLLASVPAFAQSDFIAADQIDTENAHMVFEAFGRFLLDGMRDGRNDDAIRDGFRFLNEIMTRDRGAMANLVEVSVLERFADEPWAHQRLASLLENDAKDAFGRVAGREF